MSTVAVSLVRAVADELAHQGIEPVPLLREAGIEPSLLDDASVRVPLPLYDRFQQAALEHTGDEAFGLHMGEHGSLSSFSTLGHMVAQCRTIREAIDIALQYYRLVADLAAAPTVVDRGSEVWFQYEYLRSPDPRIDRLRSEFGLTRILSIARLLLGDDAVPRETWFEHEAPPHADEYRRVFRGTERFGMTSTGFLVSRVLLERTQRYHDEGILDALRAQADRSLERLETAEGIAQRVRRLLVREHGKLRPEMDEVARGLGISARTLRRKLAAEGVGFAQLTEEALREVACTILKDSRRSLQEAAYELGFSDASSFHRAFKRWTGVTPSEYRRQEAAR
jgi:AraC-like DNA-binding protein